MKPLRSALFVGIVALALLVSLGQVMAPDVQNAEDNDNTLSVDVVSQAPVITNYAITNASDGDQMHGQLDVLTTYYFNVTVSDENGWSDIQWINIRIWFDGGSDANAYADQTTGNNYRATLNYTNVGPLGDPAVSEWSVTDGNIAYDSGNSSIFTNVANQDYTFKLAFQLNGQMFQAADPTNQGTGAYNDANSWNSEVIAIDSFPNTITHTANADNIWFEFGIFRFTSVSIGGDWSAGSLNPGEDATSNVVTVTHRSNRAYNMLVWFDTTLTNGASDTIAVTNINITASADTNDEIYTDTFFAGLTSTNSVTIRSSGVNGTHDVSGDSQTTSVQFGVSVPLGTPTGTYTATLTIRVEQP